MDDYTSTDERDGSRPLGLPLAQPVAVLALHGQLAAVAWAFAQAAPGARLGYVQTGGDVPPGGHTHTVAGTVGALLQRGLLAGHLAAAASPGIATAGIAGARTAAADTEGEGEGDGEAITTAAALHRGLRELGWDAAVCDLARDGPESGSPLGDREMAALDCAHTALALGCPVLVVARMSSMDPRRPRGGISHGALTVLDLLLEPVSVALPAGVRSPVGADLRAGLGAVFGARRPARAQVTLDGVERPARIARHDWRRAAVDLPAFAATGLGGRFGQGRGPIEDPLFFGAALAGGAVLAELAAESGYDERDEEDEGAAA
jgi:Protein of unknown function (DUF3866)